MSPLLYSFLHVVSVLLLTGGTFYAFAAPAETRKRLLALTGTASLIALIAGFGLLSKTYQNNFYPWVIVKIVCWLGLSAMTGLAYRRREKTALWVTLSIAFVALSVAMVYFKPGM
jgi:hypothetical protein